jgi:hypothetical protein
MNFWLLAFAIDFCLSNRGRYLVATKAYRRPGRHQNLTRTAPAFRISRPLVNTLFGGAPAPINLPWALRP